MVSKKDSYLEKLLLQYTCSKKSLIVCSVLLLLILALYYVTFQWLIGIWSNDKPYSHGFFIPFVTLYLVWIKREQIGKRPVAPCCVMGGIVILSCCVFLLLGRVGAIIQLEVISLYFIFPGVVLFLWGWGILRALWFPLFYLQFMIPWTDAFLHYVYPVFRQTAAILGAWFLSFRYPVFLDHTYIHLHERWKKNSDTLANLVEGEHRRERKSPFVVLVMFLVCFGIYLIFFAMPGRSICPRISTQCR